MANGVKERERLNERFAHWDNNGDGTIDRSDFEAEAREIMRKLGEDDTSPRGRAVFDAYTQMWDYLSSKAGKSSLNADEFAEVAEAEIISQGDEGFSRVLRPTVRAIVDLLDKDGDGRVSPDEFSRWLDGIGVAGDPQAVFRSIDTNGNGYVTVDELMAAVRDYHLGRTDVPLLGR
ncbi:EF-hand domain-containing protein [Streptomonospora wellingtoniae]|uniref:EF-hand domain-containing protein n=1 Tax=Streptomonospora wellingtoniae TaxID=3075544 RepID=A0ABU2KQL8_9ACTN|nr:EF-hand domain-containing protein [Streptomonospora sp. DSM 45055]MDT0301423.1 EF-hand domain-containing protein [Streptomonospora sp. DSM 45055]